MRSNLGTKSRLAAHILALALLILILVYVPAERTAPEETPVPAAPETEIAATPVPIPVPVPAEPVAIAPVAPVEPIVVVEEMPLVEPAPVVPPEPIVEEPAIAEETAEDAPMETPEPETVEPEATEPEPVEPEIAGKPAEEPVVEAEPESEPAPDPEPVVEAPPAEAKPEPTPAPESAPEPDESGSLVVAPEETGVANPVAVATPLKNANLEVLGDGVYWLSPRHDLETELAAIPELRSLILLAPLPGGTVEGFEHLTTEVIPADPADLTEDAAEQFIHMTDGANRPVVVAPLPGARGAAFFKGAYLLRNRALSEEDMLREIAPELDDAGAAKDDILHRLARFGSGAE